ncbi:MAG: cell division protein ZapA [Alphaproteobacteria bacterium]
MSEINITILGRQYPISCKPEDEAKVRELAQQLDNQMSELKQKIPNTSDINLFVINSLMNLSKPAQTQENQAPQGEIISDEDLGKLDDLASNIETLAKKLKST